MHAFNYHRPSNVNDAAALAAKSADAKVLAGGQSLVQAMKLRLAAPTDIVDLGMVKDLAGIKVDAKSVTIGAMARHAEVEGSAEIRKAIPALAALAGMIGDRQVRNMGTLGGSIALSPSMTPRSTASARSSYAAASGVSSLARRDRPA